MLVLPISFNRRQRLALAAFAATVAALLAASFFAVAGRPVEPDGATAAQRLVFLERCGYACEGETARSIRIPDRLDEVYAAYNAIQLAQGYDLENYLGRTVEQYAYTVTNYAGERDVLAHLLVCDGVIIGGDVCSTRLDGFMQGLCPREANDAA